jgi:hypothetical protein
MMPLRVLKPNNQRMVGVGLVCWWETGRKKIIENEKRQGKKKELQWKFQESRIRVRHLESWRGGKRNYFSPLGKPPFL